MKNALIIGASRGIGHEFVRQLLSDGWQVQATARTDAALAELQKLGAQPIMLDVTHSDSVADLVQHLHGKLDLAVYVAGVFGAESGADVPPSTLQFDQVMHANVLGAMQTIPLIAPMVEAASGKFVFITSGMGSIADAQGSMGWVYRASKAALNMAVHTASFDYPKATFIAMNPGWVKTDMGGPGAPTSPADSVAGMRSVIAATTKKDSGSFLSHDGKKWPW
jgi:NAD(P)-dependent dehydrogenase (short-subunit alcohol dehydrogenase family)